MPARSDGLYALDPRSKLWAAFVLVMAIILIGRLPWLGLILVIEHLILLLGGMTLRELGRIWRGLVILLLFILILQPLLSSHTGEPVLTWLPVHITDQGLMTAMRYALRLSGAAFAVLIPVTTTPMPRLVRGLEKIGLPYNWGLVIGLALHYLGTIGRLYTTISEAQQARGLSYESGGLVKRVRMAVPTVVAVIIAALRLSDSLTLGLAGRGFGMERPRTVWRDIKMHAVDWGLIALITLIGGGMLIMGQ